MVGNRPQHQSEDEEKSWYCHSSDENLVSAEHIVSRIVDDVINTIGEIMLL
tara:strand:- start:2712 stop:2864 length:153 start_codon:yes stop_codon:yes gene_type:complete